MNELNNDYTCGNNRKSIFKEEDKNHHLISFFKNKKVFIPDSINKNYFYDSNINNFSTLLKILNSKENNNDDDEHRDSADNTNNSTTSNTSKGFHQLRQVYCFYSLFFSLNSKKNKN